MNETDAEDHIPALPDDAELFLTIEFYLDEAGDMYTVADGHIPTKAVRDDVVDRLDRIARAFTTLESGYGYH